MTPAEHSLALIGASTLDHRRLRRDRAVQLAGGIDWPGFADSLQARRLLVTLGPRIIELIETPDRRFVDAVDTALESSRRRAIFLELTSERILTLLAAAGVRAAPLKGPLLAASIYGDSGRRESHDIDLMIAPDQLGVAVSTVRDLGYGAPDDFVDANGMPLLHLTLFHEGGTLPPVELHWRVHWYERDFSADRLLPPAPAAPGGWRPTLIDELTSLLLFYARDGFVGLRLATDLSAWWDTYGEQISIDGLAQTLRFYPDLRRVIPASAAAARRIVGLPDASSQAAARSLGSRQRIAVALANPNPRFDPGEIYATAGLVDGLLAPPGGLGAFFRRQVFPPPAVLEQQARHGERDQPRSRLTRAAGTVGRYALALIKTARRRERKGIADAVVDR